MPDYLRLMRVKRTAALAVALILGTAVFVLSLFVDVPAPAAATASADPIVQVDDSARSAAYLDN